MKPIDSFRGEFSFLSNFFPSDVVLDHITYRSVEHAFQAAKTTNAVSRARIQRVFSGAEAKREGRRLALRKDWEEIKLSVMEDLLRQKFSVDLLRSKLAMTYPAELIEGNSWGDTFWGAVHPDRDSISWSGENHLGKLLMVIRGDILDDRL